MKYLIERELSPRYVEYLSKYYTQEMLKAGDHNAFTTDPRNAETWPAPWLADDMLKLLKAYKVFPEAKRKQVGDDWGQDTLTFRRVEI